jgi:hypothetical protein
MAFLIFYRNWLDLLNQRSQELYLLFLEKIFYMLIVEIFILLLYQVCGLRILFYMIDDGSLYSWGGGGNFFNRGQCGFGHNRDVESPERIKSLEGKRFVKVSCGGYHTLALTCMCLVFVIVF